MTFLPSLVGIWILLFVSRRQYCLFTKLNFIWLLTAFSIILWMNQTCKLGGMGFCLRCNWHEMVSSARYHVNWTMCLESAPFLGLFVPLLAKLAMFPIQLTNPWTDYGEEDPQKSWFNEPCKVSAYKHALHTQIDLYDHGIWLACNCSARTWFRGALTSLGWTAREPRRQPATGRFPFYIVGGTIKARVGTRLRRVDGWMEGEGGQVYTGSFSGSILTGYMYINNQIIFA